MNSRQQSPPSKLHDSTLFTSSQTPSPIQKGSQKEMLVVVKVVVDEVDGMVLSDSVDSDMLELDMLESALDNEEDSSVSSRPELDSEANAEELAIVP